MLDEMRRRRAGEEVAAPEHDRLSALLHRIMSSLKAWDVVRTCVLARRWRHLWASAPCVDLRLRSGEDDAPEELARFARRLFRRRDAGAAVDTPRLRSSDEDGAFDEGDARSWIRAAIKRKARVIHLFGHRTGLALLEHAAFVSKHLKILKLSYAQVDDNMFKQLFLRCLSLEEMDLKDCLLSGSEISSSSLKTLAMVNCNMFWGLTVSAPNLVQLLCITPIGQAPSFKNMDSLVSGTIVLDDYSFSSDFEDFSKDELDETTDDDEFDSDDDDSYADRKRKRKTGHGFGFSEKRHKSGGYSYNDHKDCGSDIDSDDNTVQYSEIANQCAESGYACSAYSSKKGGSHQIYGGKSGSSDSKILSGHNLLHSLANATNLELLADGEEVQPSVTYCLVTPIY